ncbi:hypothetical protein EDD95_5147 [Streptomyces sp. CEV 2-1]|nr:hypothetical protein EDD95_5147 [Streptomyces sp. CEV 2-1]
MDSRVRSHSVAIELADELIELERAAWTEQQEGQLTVETSMRVHAAITAHAEATGQPRAQVEQALKKSVRYPDGPPPR